MSSSMDLNNNLIKNPSVIESLNDDGNRNNLTICKDSFIINNLNQNPFSSVKALVKGQSVGPENCSWKPNVKKINTTNEVPQIRGRSLSNKNLASIVNLTAKPNLAANDMFGNVDSNSNQLAYSNHIIHDNWQTYGNSGKNGNHHTIGNIISNSNHQTSGSHFTNSNHFSQSDSLHFSLNEEIVLPYLTDIIKELPELSINLVSEVLLSLGDDSSSGKIDAPLLDSKQVYQVLSNFNPEFLPFPFQYMDLFHSNAFSMPKRHLKNSITDTAGDTYHQDAPDRTKINNDFSPEPQNHLAEVELPPSTSVQDSIIETNKQPVGPCKSVYNDVQGSNNNEKMTYLNVQRSNTASCAPKNVPCACPDPKISQSNLKTKETSKVQRDETKPFKIGKVKSNRKTGLQKGAKISHGPKLGPHTSHLGTPSSKSFSAPKPYKCKECSKTFTLLGSLTRHLKIHVKKCLHVCNVCQKSFQTKNHLNNHIKTHKKHKSETCSKSFKTNKKLAKKHKTKSACRNHKCDVCEKSFSCSSNLKRHSLIHTRAKHHSNEDSCKSLNQNGSTKKPTKVKLCCKFCLKQFQVEKRFQIHVQKCMKK